MADKLTFTTTIDGSVNPATSAGSLSGGQQQILALTADEEGGDVIPPHTATRIIGEVLAEIDARPV